MTQFAFRLAEKQKLRFYYGISEKQLVRYVKSARLEKGSTGQLLLQKLEIRLDNVVYRLGLAPTLPIARQMVNHGHIFVNDKCVTIASFTCVPFNIIKIKNTSTIHQLVKGQEKELPSHLSLNSDTMIAVIKQISARNEIPLDLNELLVIEYYSNRL